METTQLVTAKYTELYDMSTEVGENVYYKVHTPTGISHIKKLAGFYKQFKEYKYLGANIALVPITTLPKDLLGVGYEAGDGVDPRDLINPILHKGYKGEALITNYLSERTLWTENEDATDADNQGDHKVRAPRMTESGGMSYQKITGDEPYASHIRDTIRAMYYTSLTDPEWSKAHPREGFYRELFPVVRTLASTGPISGNAVRQTIPEEEPIDSQNLTHILVVQKILQIMIYYLLYFRYFQSKQIHQKMIITFVYYLFHSLNSVLFLYMFLYLILLLNLLLMLLNLHKL